MKKIQWLLVLTILSLSSCVEKVVVNRYVKMEDGSIMMIGRQEENAFKHEAFYIWYQKEYEAYKPEATIIEKIKKNIDNYEIEIYFGTWCSDSKREVPRFMKILNEAKFPKKQLRFYAVSRKKESFYGEEQGKNIIRVPTFIFYEKAKKYSKKSKKEVNRIIESPVNKELEDDMLKILMNNNYIPNYYF